MSRRPSLTAQVGDRLYNPDNFQSKIKVVESGCWEWQGVKNNIGYPFVGVWHLIEDKYKMMLGHRLALMIKLGREILPGMNANHIVCHNRLCVNPDHLAEGTQREKLDAMVAEGILKRPDRVDRGPYLHEQFGRTYKYSKQEITWVRDAEVKDIMVRYKLPQKRANAMRHTFRTGYRWLPWTNDK